MRRGLSISLVLAGWIAGGCAPEDGPADETPTGEELVEACEDATACSADACGDELQAIADHLALEPEDIESAEWAMWDEARGELEEQRVACYDTCTEPHGTFMTPTECQSSCTLTCAASRGALGASDGFDCGSYATICG